MIIRRAMSLTALTWVYLAVAFATFTHTTWSMAITLQGVMPDDTIGQLWWGLQGVLGAIAIDVGMMVTARRLSHGWSTSMAIAFAIAAVASAYTQVLYALHHASQFMYAAGVTGEWESRLNGWVNARIVLMPIALPLFATLYAIANRGSAQHETDVVKKLRAELRRYKELVNQLQEGSPGVLDAPPEVLARCFYSPYKNKLYGPYKTVAVMESQRKGHFTLMERQEVPLLTNGSTPAE